MTFVLSCRVRSGRPYPHLTARSNGIHFTHGKWNRHVPSFRIGVHPPRRTTLGAGPDAPGRGAALAGATRRTESPSRRTRIRRHGPWRSLGNRTRAPDPPVKTNVSITPAAELDLLETMGWYESIRPGLSRDFLLAFDAAINQIARHPTSHALLERGLRRALLHRFSHGVFYLSFSAGHGMDYRRASHKPRSARLAVPRTLTRQRHTASAEPDR